VWPLAVLVGPVLLEQFLALAVSLEHLGRTFDNDGARILAETLDAATGEFLRNGKSPSRKVRELDNRGSHFYLALYWSRVMAKQAPDDELRERFSTLAEALSANEERIVGELRDAQGSAVEIGGYYRPDPERAAMAMRPSATLNAILEAARGEID